MSLASVVGYQGQAEFEKERRTGSRITRLLDSKPSFQVINRQSAARETTEAYVADNFREEYDARIRQFMPYILSMSCGSRVCAAVGIRPGTNIPLFVEHYFPEPLSDYIEQANGAPVDPQYVVETGNLIATQRGKGSLLLGMLTTLLHARGYQWAVFTATDQLVRLLTKLKFDVTVLCDAKPECLGEEAADWGTYYETSPQVVLINIAQAKSKIDSNYLLAGMVKLFEKNISGLVKQLKK